MAKQFLYIIVILALGIIYGKAEETSEYDLDNLNVVPYTHPNAVENNLVSRIYVDMANVVTLYNEVINEAIRVLHDGFRRWLSKGAQFVDVWTGAIHKWYVDMKKGVEDPGVISELNNTEDTMNNIQKMISRYFTVGNEANIQSFRNEYNDLQKLVRNTFKLIRKIGENLLRQTLRVSYVPTAVNFGCLQKVVNNIQKFISDYGKRLSECTESAISFSALQRNIRLNVNIENVEKFTNQLKMDVNSCIGESSSDLSIRCLQKLNRSLPEIGKVLENFFMNDTTLYETTINSSQSCMNNILTSANDTYSKILNEIQSCQS